MIALALFTIQEGVQVRVQVEVGREEQGERETHGESERRDNEEQSLNRSSWMARIRCDARCTDTFSGSS